jgi:hypothetical protein
MLPTHELTFAQQCERSALSLSLWLLFHCALRNDDAEQSARAGEIHYSACFLLASAACSSFSGGRFCCWCTQAGRRRCGGARFLLSWGIRLIFFSLSTAISFNHVHLLFRLIKFAHSAPARWQNNVHAVNFNCAFLNSRIRMHTLLMALRKFYCSELCCSMFSLPFVSLFASKPLSLLYKQSGRL